MPHSCATVDCDPPPPGVFLSASNREVIFANRVGSHDMPACLLSSWVHAVFLIVMIRPLVNRILSISIITVGLYPTTTEAGAGGGVTVIGGFARG